MAAQESQSWGHRLWPAATFQFALIAGVTQLKTAANALVLSRFESHTMPYLYLVGALLVATLTLLPRREPGARSESLSVLTGAGGLVVLGLAAGVSMGQRIPALVLYLFVDAFTTIISLRFWGRMASAFDAREARRAFTALNGVGMAGGMLGGLLVQGLAERLGTASIVVSGALSLYAAGVAFHFHHSEAPQPMRLRHMAPSVAAWEYLSTSSYARVLAALGVSFAVLSSFVDYLFRLRVENTLSEDGLAALFGSLQLWIGLVCVLFQLLLAERLLKRMGLMSYLALLPGAMAPLAVASLLTKELWPVHLLRLLENAVNYSLLPVGVQLLYAAVPDEEREALRGAVDGLLRKGGTILAGVLLIGAGRAANGVTMALAVMGLCGLLGVLLLRLRPAYVEALGEQVGAQREDDEELGREDRKLLVEALGSSAPDRVLHALDLMEEEGLPLRPHLPVLLHHTHERVQERAVALALELGATETAPLLEQLVTQGARRPRDSAVGALAKLAPERAEVLLPPLLQSTDVGLRCAAVGALLSTKWRAAAQVSLGAMAARGAQAPVSDRREVARLFGRLKDTSYTPMVTPYLNDPDSSVRRVALRSVGEGGYVKLAPKLLTFLTWREERREAREALAALGDEVTPLLEATLNDLAAPLPMRLQVPRVLRLIGTPGSLHALLFSNVRDDARLHFRIGAELSRLRDEHPEHPVDEDRVREALGRRRDVYRALVEPYRDLRAELGDHALLTRVVGDRLDQALELSFFLLGLLHPPHVMRRVHQQVAGQDARRRAYALELLETLTNEEDRALVREQVELHHRDLPPGTTGQLEAHLAWLCRSEDVVLRACARYVAGRIGMDLPPSQEGDMSQATVQKLFLLEEVHVFSQSDVDDVAAVAAIAREARFRAGERVFSQGDPGDALYVIIEGVVDARSNGEHVLRMRAKETFGDLSLLDGAPRPTDAIAVEDTRVLVIDRRDFLDLLADRPELLTGFFRAVTQQLRAVINASDQPLSGAHLVPLPKDEQAPAPEEQKRPLTG
ncbi:cyclic nucleotide-binding domain-containing protein [Archangium lansingense]|uniref:Cyclic nucleotide-binding domain-containing protein n=1 Tax=Archangium lansingense TaxID=2995310 RepID=A0ABT4A9G8_9BACT|nr:cyclic nucleotide-binding domain-containing protein [Archangium lansinium]MCY1077604.1 cyclic nucleotide-binding domain-containing protein [Archangium lansinium]